MPLPYVAAPIGAAKLLGDEIANLLLKHAGLPRVHAARVADEVLQELQEHAYTRPACMQCGSFEVAPYEDTGFDYETGPWCEDGYVCRNCGCRDADCAHVVVLAHQEVQ
jgi:hypothetical protein